MQVSEANEVEELFISDEFELTALLLDAFP